VIYLVVTVHIIVSIFLILVVLLQRGAGADLSVFGGGGTQAAFGARSAATLLHKLTVWSFVAFTVTTISYNFLASHRDRGSVLSETAGAAAVETVTPEATPADPLAAQPEPVPSEADAAAVDQSPADEATAANNETSEEEPPE